jgi:hypothetical protein
MNAEMFTFSVLVGAALLALWIEVRYPSLAPKGLLQRFIAVVVGGVVLQLGAVGFERVLGLPLGSTPGALLALAVLLPAMTFSLVTAIWLLRSLQGVGAMR